jgi:hypothetical protein
LEWEQGMNKEQSQKSQNDEISLSDIIRVINRATFNIYTVINKLTGGLVALFGKACCGVFKFIFKNKNVFFVIIAIGIIAGYAASMLLPKKYEFRQVLEVANYNGTTPVQDLGTVQRILARVIMPSIVTQYINQPKVIEILNNKFHHEFIKNDHLNFVLFGMGKLEEQAIYAKIFQNVLQDLQNYQASRIDSLKSSLGKQLMLNSEHMISIKGLIKQEATSSLINNKEEGRKEKIGATDAALAVQNSVENAPVLSAMYEQIKNDRAINDEKYLYDIQNKNLQVLLNLNTIQKSRFLTPMNIIQQDSRNKIWLEFIVLSILASFLVSGFKEIIMKRKKLI